MSLHVPKATHFPYSGKTGDSCDSYVKAVVLHHEAGQPREQFIFMHGYNSTTKGDSGLARRALEDVVVAWVKKRERPHEGMYGYKPNVRYSTYTPGENDTEWPSVGTISR